MNEKNKAIFNYPAVYSIQHLLSQYQFNPPPPVKSTAWYKTIMPCCHFVKCRFVYIHQKKKKYVKKTDAAVLAALQYIYII